MTEEVLNEVENKEEKPKNEKDNKSAFMRIKERFSIRSKSKNKKSLDNNQENDESKKGEQVENENVNVTETTTEKNVEPEVQDEKTEEKEKKTKSGSTLERVKMRLSSRKKNPKTSDNGTKQEEDNNVSSKDENITSEDDKKKCSEDDEKETEEKTKEEKSKNFLQRVMRFFRSKKNRGSAEKQIKEAENSADVANDEAKNDGNSSDEEDNEIIAICGKSEEEEEKEKAVVIPTITTNKPPLPGGRRLPCSATTSHTRPMSQLDEALKQFKLSTAASRENIRNSRQDLSQMEEQVKVQLRSRPATPVLSLRPQQLDVKLSSSLSDLRQ